MLAADVAGQPCNKAEHNRDLQARIDRSRSSTEFKHQNISAALQGLRGMAARLQACRQLADNLGRCGGALARAQPGLAGPDARRAQNDGYGRHAPLWIGPPPTLSNQPRRPRWSRCCTSPASPMWPNGMPATAPLVGLGRNGRWHMERPPWPKPGEAIWPAGFAGCRQRKAMVRVTTSKALRRTGGPA